MGTILLVDDEPGVLFTLEEVLLERGHVVISARSGAEALERLEPAAMERRSSADSVTRPAASVSIDVVVSDLAMPGMSGLELLQAVRERYPGLPVILLTARGSERVAVQAMKAGAWDYLHKPFDIDEVALVVERALETVRLRRDNRRLEAERAIGRPVIGDSPAMRRLLEAVSRLADREVTVLVRGETGTGKELVASMLHAQSRRSSHPLVRFNCAAIPAELADAELFGHTKGAFTGATAARDGYFRRADGGTLVLDEIGELPLSIQAKLLRVLQEGEIQPVGAARVERVDVRVVACTHRDLRLEAAAGRFREDLYYRLAVVELEAPPLRARREDIPLLVETFRRRCADRFGLEDVRFTPGLLERLCAYDWPGNVRELENAVTRMIALSAGGEIDVDAFQTPGGVLQAPGGVLQAPGAVAASRATSTGGEDTERETGEGGAGRGSLRAQVAAFERALLSRTLRETGGNQSEAARRLGMSRVTLIDKLKRHGLW